MNDLISRKALIAEYDRVHIGEPGKARKLMEDVPAVREWIPVSERLPEDDQWVLCIDFDGDYLVVAWSYIDWMWSDQKVWYEEKHFTHWMPLPEPPKEEE